MKDLFKRIWYWTAWMCARLILIFLFHVRVFGKENVPTKGGFILLSTHQSYLDPVICAGPLKRTCYFVAKDALFDVKFFGKLIYSFNAVPIKRGKPDLSIMKFFIEKLKRGYGLVLYPEAARTADGKIQPLGHPHGEYL